jgi:hypothetical protein
MQTMTSHLPIACDPTAIPPKDRARRAAVSRRLFRGAVRTDVRVDDQEGWHFEIAASAYADLADWVALERLCCPFLRFRIDVAPPPAKLTFTMTGPIGTIAFLEQEIG